MKRNIAIIINIKSLPIVSFRNRVVHNGVRDGRRRQNKRVLNPFYLILQIESVLIVVQIDSLDIDVERTGRQQIHGHIGLVGNLGPVLGSGHNRHVTVEHVQVGVVDFDFRVLAERGGTVDHAIEKVAHRRVAPCDLGIDSCEHVECVKALKFARAHGESFQSAHEFALQLLVARLGDHFSIAHGRVPKAREIVLVVDKIKQQSIK